MESPILCPFFIIIIYVGRQILSIHGNRGSIEYTSIYHTEVYLVNCYENTIPYNDNPNAWLPF